jgi:2,4-dienoyl-CoA reductase-like NADH-dependent reductase (Old Yellow Enzyme family)
MSSALFSPITLGALELPNRIVVSPLCQFSAVDGTAQPWHFMNAMHHMASGTGLLILEATAVEDIGRITLGCLGLYSDENEAALTRLIADARTMSNTPIGIQLSHAGRKASSRPTWELWKGPNLQDDEGAWVPVGPTGEAFNDGWPAPKELDAQGLTRIIDMFVDSTRRSHRCGFDMIEVHVAHGYLLHQFLSPMSNKRTDKYGGSIENNMRFPLEVIAAMREAFPQDKPMGVRTTGRDFNDGGLELDHAVVFARALKKLGIDYIVPSAGNVAPGMKLPKIEPGYMVHFAERIKKDAGIATMAVGLIVKPEQANAIIESGQADMVAIGRAFIDDPRWAWHAAVSLGEENPPIPPPWARVNPKVWPAYKMARNENGDLQAGMGHMRRE